MRITYASLFAAAFCLHAGNSYSQKVTLQGENLSVKEYMTAIESRRNTYSSMTKMSM